jgi:dimethylaniline monooxygenase (N-oxide forming)
MEICVIGAGSSGLTTIKALKDQNIPFDCFEKGSGIGGNWRYENDNGMSSAYRSLHINTSREMMAYEDFPMPDDYPDYPHHSQILAYFEDYANHFGLKDHIIFNTGVEKVSKLSDGKYEVTTDTGLKKTYTGVIVCNGHHWDPRFPEPAFPGTFDGEVLHAHYYKTPDLLRNKRVLVLGIGNSGVDIACESSRNAEKTFLATRSGAHIMPKYILGKPTDTLDQPPLTYMPLWLKRKVLGLSLFIARGKQESYGVPTPDRKLLQEHPTISQDLLNLVGHGKIDIKPNIRELAGEEVLFEDGSREKIDLLIYATGYKISFPFFEKDFLSAPGNQIGLYRKVVHPKHENLFFIGLIQPLGPIMPLAEVQARWVAGLLKGNIRLPQPSKMLAEIEQSQQAMQKRYVDRPRHTIQVDFFPYKRLINKEIKRHSIRQTLSSS